MTQTPDLISTNWSFGQPVFHIGRVIEYCSEEVHRQGHDLTIKDGIERVGWLLNGWTYALGMSSLSQSPDVSDAIKLGTMVEPVKNRFGIRTCGVRVGSQKCPPPERVQALLTTLWESRDIMKPIEFYKAFEQIHPFVDGNGRTGKVLLNWLNLTLLNPIFPPADMWGAPIRNP